MGIKQLYKNIASLAPTAIQTLDLSEVANSTIVVDLYLYLHRFNSTMGNSFTGLFHQITSLKKHNITPIYIIDGKCPALKASTIQERKKAIEKKKKKYQVAEKDKTTSKAELFKLKNLTYRVDEKEIAFCKKLFDYLGVPWLQAKGEADILMASMVKDKKADACLSADGDILTFGCPVVWKKLKSGKVEVCYLEKVLEGMKLTLENFRIFCILSGCDYIETVKGVGPKTALKLLHLYSGIEEIIESGKIPKSYKWKPVLKIFETEEKTRKTKFTFGKVQKEKLLKFLRKEMDFSEMRLNNIEDRL